MNPITTQLNYYASRAISLHVPGHHNGTIGNLDIKLSYDMTEITGLDDYHHAETIIADSERLLTRHSDYQSRYLVNGTTTGLLSVLQSVKSSSVAVMRNVHKSVFNGLTMAGLKAYILPTTVSTVSQQYAGIDFSMINKKDLEEVTLAVLTYPNYFGETYDIKAAIEFFHDCDIEVLVDEAHGAHFDIAAGFPVSSIHYGADYVVQSYHKTLPALTMGSVIHIHHEASLKNNICRYLSILQTSSPSYLVLSSLEQAHAFYVNYDAANFWQKRSILIQQLSHQVDVVEMDDPLKLMIRKDSYSGTALQSLLEKQFIYTELATLSEVLLVLPLWHEGDHFPMDRLLTAIKKTDVTDIPANNMIQAKNTLPTSPGYFNPVEGEERIVSLVEGIGYYTAQSLIPYPPGIPFVVAGERLTEGHVTVLQKYVGQGIRIHGMIDGKITIVE